MNIKILIAFYSDSKGILNTVSKICENNIPKPCNVELILIENGPKRNFDQYFEKFSANKISIKYFYTNKGNKSHALNLAISNLKSDEPIIFTDDDIQVNKNWIYSYYQYFKNFGEGYFFGGDVKCDYETNPSKYIKHLLPQSAIGTDKSYFLNKKRLFFGCNWGCYSSVIKEAGYFNEDLGPGTNKTGQESEMQLRLRKIGLKQIYIPNNPVTHYVPSNKASWDFIINRVDRIMHEKKILKPNRRERVRFELSKAKYFLKKSPKHRSAIIYTFRYILFRLIKAI